MTVVMTASIFLCIPRSNKQEIQLKLIPHKEEMFTHKSLLWSRAFKNVLPSVDQYGFA